MTDSPSARSGRYVPESSRARLRRTWQASRAASRASPRRPDSARRSLSSSSRPARAAPSGAAQGESNTSDKPQEQGEDGVLTLNGA